MYNKVFFRVKSFFFEDIFIKRYGASLRKQIKKVRPLDMYMLFPLSLFSLLIRSTRWKSPSMLDTRAHFVGR